MGRYMKIPLEYVSSVPESSMPRSEVISSGTNYVNIFGNNSYVSGAGDKRYVKCMTTTPNLSFTFLKYGSVNGSHYATFPSRNCTIYKADAKSPDVYDSVTIISINMSSLNSDNDTKLYYISMFSDGNYNSDTSRRWYEPTECRYSSLREFFDDCADDIWTDSVSVQIPVQWGGLETTFNIQVS